MDEKTKITVIMNDANTNTSTPISEDDETLKESESQTLECRESTITASVYETIGISTRKDGTIEKIPRWQKVRNRLSRLKNQFLSTYSKRNPIVNALLSLFLILTIIVSLMDISFSLTLMFGEFGNFVWLFGIVLMFYAFFCLYYIWRFIAENHKSAVWPSFMGSICIWYVIFFFYVIFPIYVLEETPNSEFLDENGNESSSSGYIMFVFPFILSFLFNAILFGVIRLIMEIRKYGASAWSLLDNRRGNRPKPEKISLIVFSSIWLLPVGVLAYYNYKDSSSTDKYPTHSTAQIGDYYYADGTISSVWDVDKTAIGVAFSLEVSEADKMQGFTHGQIVALSDLSDKKQPWESGNSTDIMEYPNYGWDNRMDALKDLNGLGYMHCHGTGALQITYDCLNYREQDEIQGISCWHVPTAGQWSKILENLGNTKVDKMLRFDAEVAAESLDRIHIDPKRWYWTITEFDAEYAWSIRLADGEFGSRTNKQNEAFVRPVAAF